MDSHLAKVMTESLFHEFAGLWNKRPPWRMDNLVNDGKVILLTQFMLSGFRRQVSFNAGR